MKKNKQFSLYRFAFPVILLASAALLFSCKKDKNDPPDNILNFEGAAVPSSGQVNTTATGTLTASYNEDTKVLSYTFTWSGLSSVIGGFHIHKGSGGVIINFKDDGYSTAQSGTFSGSATLADDTWVQDLKDSKLYGQIHTGTYPGGELKFPFNLK